jgi:hypothetical protein
MINKNLLLIVLIVFVGILGYFAFIWEKKEKVDIGNPLYARFQALASEGNSSCSSIFKDSISSMSDESRIKGSCCSPMSWHRYEEQVEGLKRFSEISEIPPDPYDIDAKIAKKMEKYYDVELTNEEQKVYDYAVANSDEKGPCCCKCWRWYVYGGLAKFLIKEKGFSGEQITEVWNLSDGCGGEGDHVSHAS